MTIQVKLAAPATVVGAQIVTNQGNTYQVAADGSVTVNANEVLGLIAAGFHYFDASSDSITIEAPLPADLVSIVAAANAANGSNTLTIAGQPVHARKLQFRIVDDGTHHITAGTVTVTGTDQDGNSVSDTFSAVTAVSLTQKSTHAYASVATVKTSGIAGAGGTTTFGFGVSNDFGVPGGANAVDLVCNKATKTTAVLGTSVTSADDVASTTTVDATARTIAPTTAPDASGLINFQFLYSFAQPA